MTLICISIRDMDTIKTEWIQEAHGQTVAARPYASCLPYRRIKSITYIHTKGTANNSESKRSKKPP